MASNCAVATKLVVSNDFKVNWVPDSQEVEGATFMRISKWDRNFVRFCTGQALLFSGGTRRDVNVSFIEVLQRLRTSVVDSAVAKAFTDEEGGRKRKRSRKARVCDRDLVPSILSIDCPEIRRGELLVPAMTMRILFGIKNHDLWIEALPANLEYIRHGVVSALDAEETGRKWKRTKRQTGAELSSGNHGSEAEDENDDHVDGDGVHDHGDDHAGLIQASHHAEGML
jgi:hypothetical protein